MRTLVMVVVFCVSIQVVMAREWAIAEPLLVDLRADDVVHSRNVEVWPNRGSLGDFTGSGRLVGVQLAGLPGVMFDGESWFDGPNSVPEIEGNSPRTIEVLCYNVSVASNEETLVSWSHRDCPNGGFMAMSYGQNASWGAVSHWWADLGWEGSHSPAPAAHNWWYLVYTFNGTRAKVFVNGVLESSKDIANVDTLGGNRIRIGCQNDSTGEPFGYFHFTGFISEVRIHGNALSDNDVLNNMDCIVEKYVGTDETLAYWRLDEGSGDVALDSMRARDPGIITGAT